METFLFVKGTTKLLWTDSWKAQTYSISESRSDQICMLYLDSESKCF